MVHSAVIDIFVRTGFQMFFEKREQMRFADPGVARYRLNRYFMLELLPMKVIARCRGGGKVKPAPVVSIC